MMLVKKHASPRVAFQTPSFCLSLCSAVLKFLPRPPGTQKRDHISRKQRNIVCNNANPCCNSLQIYAKEKDMWLLFLIAELIAYGIRPNFCKFWETSNLYPMPSALFPWISWDGETVLSFCLWRSFFHKKSPKLREVEGGSKLQPPVESKSKQFYHIYRWHQMTVLQALSFFILKSWITNHPIGVAVV